MLMWLVNFSTIFVQICLAQNDWGNDCCDEWGSYNTCFYSGANVIFIATRRFPEMGFCASIHFSAYWIAAVCVSFTFLWSSVYIFSCSLFHFVTKNTHTTFFRSRVSRFSPLHQQRCLFSSTNRLQSAAQEKFDELIAKKYRIKSAVRKRRALSAVAQYNVERVSDPQWTLMTSWLALNIYKQYHF